MADQHFRGGNAELCSYREPYVGEAMQLLCRDLDQAAAFLAAFPKTGLAGSSAVPDLSCEISWLVA